MLRSVEHSCPHHLEGVTSPFTVLVLGQSVDGLRVSIGDGHVRLEVGHDLFAPVAHSPDQIAPDFLLALRNGGYPVVQGGFCLGSCGGVPDAVKAFLVLVGGQQLRECACPGLHDEAFPV
ncbi:Uncharacterised protein [Klebsiella pneumoniae]|nr:Uncharacterised protein [Klebsiella pneumoniae]